MPPKPVFKSTRTQSVAVAVVMAMVLVCATGLASLQAGSGPEYLSTSSKRELTLAQPQGGDGPSTIYFNLPDGWKVPQNDQGGVVLIDPQRPMRRLNLVTVVINEQATPEQMITRFIKSHPDPSVRATLRPAAQPFVFSLAETGLRGAQFIGISEERRDGPDNGGSMIREHLMACLSPDGIHYWLIYLTDTVELDSDVGESLRANTRLLQTVYRSASADPQ